MNPTNPFGDENTPQSGDQLNQTCQKILAQTILNGGGSAFLFVPNPPISSSSPGSAGKYSVDSQNFYFYTTSASGGKWLQVPGNTF